MLNLTRGRLRLLRWLGRERRKPALSACARTLLGPNASARFDEFSRYRDGWDFGRGRRLTPGSATTLERFLVAHPFEIVRPSLFLTHEGFLELAWESDGARRIELEFQPDRVAYYVAADGSEQEGTIRAECVGELRAILDAEPALHP
jgi:hypothetical protein